MRYAELQVTTHYSFLRGASSPRELFEQAKRLGIGALGIVDRNSLAGIVKAHEAAKETGIRLVVGCRIDLTDGTSILVYPTDRAAYSRLCRLLSLGKSRAGKGKCALGWDDVAIWNEGLIAVLLGDDLIDERDPLLSRMIEVRRQYGGSVVALIEVEPIRGAWPRNFNLDPTVKWLLAAGQNSNTVSIFKVNQDTGESQFTKDAVYVPSSICVLF